MNSSKSSKKPHSRLIRPRASKSQKDVEQIAQLMEKIEMLDNRVEKLENGKKEESTWEELRKLIPSIPSTPSPAPFYQENRRCPVCHELYKNMTNYVCPRMDCPGKITFTCGTSNP